LSNIINIDGKSILDPKLSRIGKFGIPIKMVRLEFDVVVGLLDGMVVLEAETDNEQGIIKYTAVAPHLFDDVKEGHVIPIYDIGKRVDGIWEFHRRD
jgi:hypothetical protein